MERALEAEMAQHLGHAKNVTVTNPAGNTRNGKKTFKDDFDKLPIEVPHDRHASFAPQIVTKHQPAGVALTTKFSCSFMDELFSGRAYCKRTVDEVFSECPKTVPRFAMRQACVAPTQCSVASRMQFVTSPTVTIH